MTKGQCLCGKVVFEVTGNLGDVRLCYCDNCRRARGTAFSANSRVATSQFELRSGKEKISEYESTPGVFGAFCSVCGSPIYARVVADPDHIRVRLGTLANDVEARIVGHVWVGSKPKWYAITDDLPQWKERALTKGGLI